VTHLAYAPTYELPIERGHARATIDFSYPFGNGGTITTLNAGANCTNQQYRVSDGLENVRTSTTSGGSGSFVVTLTHYRYSLFGHCVIYKARVSGALSVSY